MLDVLASSEKPRINSFKAKLRSKELVSIGLAVQFGVCRLNEIGMQ